MYVEVVRIAHACSLVKWTLTRCDGKLIILYHYHTSITVGLGTIHISKHLTGLALVTDEWLGILIHVCHLKHLCQ